MTYYIHDILMFLIGDVQDCSQTGGGGLGLPMVMNIINAADKGNLKKLKKLWITNRDAFDNLQYAVAKGTHAEPLSEIAAGNGDLALFKWTYEGERANEGVLTHNIYEEIQSAKASGSTEILDWINNNVDSLDNYED